MVDFDLFNVIESIIETLAVQAQEKGLELLFSVGRNVPETVKGDPARLRQIIVNLVGNAVKFTEKGEVLVRVEVESAYRNPDAKLSDTGVLLHFFVSDTGIGIPQDKVNAIFESFTQVDSSTTRRFGGTGLGLSICKQLVNLMGGKIGLSSVVGQGTTFYFTIRLFPAVTVPETPDLMLAEFSGARVLIVDDNDVNRFILNEYLALWGIIASEAVNGYDGLRKLSEAAALKRPFKLVLMDYHMPDMDGIETVEKIVNDPRLSDTRIIMLTSADKVFRADRFEALGIAACLHKPIKRDLLRSTILTVLEGLSGPVRTPGKPVEEPGTGKGLRILVVEDNVLNRELAVRLLEKLRHKVSAAFNGKEAVDLLCRERFDLVFMDVEMPEMDGLQATATVRSPLSSVLDHKVPIIAMTAFAMKGDRERCLECGMNDYISKPINVGELYKVLERWSPEDNSAEVRTLQPELLDGVINKSEALSRINGDEEFYNKMCEMFLRYLPEHMEGLGKAVAARDMAEASRQAHSLKSSSGSIGAKAMSESSAALEAVARGGDYDGTLACFSHLAEEKDKVIKALKAIVQQ